MEAKISSKTKLNHRLLKLSLAPVNEYLFKAGQYAVLSAPKRNTDIKGYYSIASSSSSSRQVEFLIRTGDGSKASEFFGSLPEGEPVDLSAPAGAATFKKPGGHRSIFISSGTGFAPHLSILRSHKGEFGDSPVEAMCGILTENDRFEEDAIETLRSEIPNFSFKWIYSQEDQDASQPAVMIADYFSSLELNDQDIIYACGQPEMVKAIESESIKNGIKESHFIKERY